MHLRPMRFKRRPTLLLLILAVLCGFIFYIYKIKTETKESSAADQPEDMTGWPELPRLTDDLGNMTAVREMLRFAWQGYIKWCALKQSGNELAPVSNSCSYGADSLVGERNLLTAVDALDTLLVTGLHDEFQVGRNLTSQAFRLLNPVEVSVFEVTIRLIGGLLGAFSLTDDPMFVRLATDIADGLSEAFQKDDFPNKVFLVNQKLVIKGTLSEPQMFASSGVTNPSEVGSLYLEFAYLSHITKHDRFFNWVNRNQNALMQVSSLDGLLPIELSAKFNWQLEALSNTYSAGSFGDSYYEYLVKRCLFDDPVEPDCISVFSQALDGIMKHLTVVTNNNLTCIATLGFAEPMSCRMEHLTCFAGGMFALAYLQDPTRTDWLEYAENVTKTCYLSYLHSPTGLGPEVFFFDKTSQKMIASDDRYLLRPETVESIYYLYRVTGKQMYRDWGWSIIKALNSSARTASGFSGLRNMHDTPEYDNIQWSFFLAETLKYLYLLFTSSDTLPMDQWVFNTEAHVIPSNRNPLRRKLRSMPEETLQ